jgi:hypothetical protein
MKTTIYILFSLSVAMICIPGSAQDMRTWATYYGGTGNEGAFSVARDDSGNVYIAGITQSYSGIAFNGFQNTFGGGVVDAYLAKFDAAGNRIWATYYGGTGDEMAFFGGKMGIATDAFGNVYMAGFTNSTTGIALNGFQNSPGGTAVNAYLVKFDSAGNRIWGTYYGGANADKAYAVSTDGSGNIYIAGIASSAGLAYQGFQNTSGGLSDALLVKFDTNGNRLWATYYGGPGADEGFSVASDNEGNVYLAGHTTSTTAIASGGFQNTFGGGSNDLFLVKFDSSGNRLWSTYYGSTGDEMMLFNGDIDVATDVFGNVLLTGLTTSISGIASAGFQNTFGGGGSDAILVKFDAAGNRNWATYYGGTDFDKGYAVTTDAAANIYLAGRTDSPNDIASGGFQNLQPGPHDAFLVMFRPNGGRYCATYFGGTDVDECNDVAVSGLDTVYLAGNTANTSGIAWNGFQNFHGGGTSDALLVQFTSCSIPTSVNETSYNAGIIVYPNPSSGKFTISGEYHSTIEIFNMLGKLICTFNNLDYKKEIDISNLKKGIYCILINDGRNIKTEKIFIM